MVRFLSVLGYVSEIKVKLWSKSYVLYISQKFYITHFMLHINSEDQLHQYNGSPAPEYEIEVEVAASRPQSREAENCEVEEVECLGRPELCDGGSPKEVDFLPKRDIFFSIGECFPENSLSKVLLFLKMWHIFIRQFRNDRSVFCCCFFFFLISIDCINVTMFNHTQKCAKIRESQWIVFY